MHEEDEESLESFDLEEGAGMSERSETVSSLRALGLRLLTLYLRRRSTLRTWRERARSRRGKSMFLLLTGAGRQGRLLHDRDSQSQGER